MARQEALRAALVLVGVAGILAVVRRAGAVVAPTEVLPPAAEPELPLPEMILEEGPEPAPSLFERIQEFLTPQGQCILAATAPFEAEIQAAATTWGVDPNLVRAVMWQESRVPGTCRVDPLAARFEPHVNDTSFGLMQLLLATARQMGFAGTPQDLVDPATNVMLGAQYLRRKLDEFGDVRLGVASYNSGSPITCTEASRARQVERGFRACRLGELINEEYVRAVNNSFTAISGSALI